MGILFYICIGDYYFEYRTLFFSKKKKKKKTRRDSSECFWKDVTKARHEKKNPSSTGRRHATRLGVYCFPFAELEVYSDHMGDH